MSDGRYYFIDESTEENAQLVHAITTVPRTYVTMHGPRASGKTTRVIQLYEQLRGRGYACAVLSLEEGVPFDTTARFWRALGDLIFQRLPPHQRFMSIRICDASTFIDFFSNLANKVVLIVDDFELLCPHETVKTEFLTTLRALRQAHHDHGLHAFIAVGSSAIQQLRRLTFSPFNASDSQPMFERHHVRELFSQYSCDTGVEVAEEIPDAIYDLTDGHPGLVSFCGQRIAEGLIEGTRSQAVDYRSWVRYAATALVPDLSTNCATMSTMVDVILDDEHEHSREFLVRNFLLQDPSLMEDRDGHGAGWRQFVFVAATPHDISHCEFLSNEGILRVVGINRFTLASFLVRNLVTWAICNKTPRKYHYIPQREDGSYRLNMPQLMQLCLMDFNKHRMSEAPESASKALAAMPGGYQSVPSQACYHHELFNTLANRLDRLYSIAYEVNAPINSRPGNCHTAADQSCSLVISSKPRGTWKCVIQLCASATQLELQDHFDQASAYGAAHSANKTWLINFQVANSNGESPKLIWQEGLNVMHVVHDIGWANGKLHANNEEALSLARILRPL